MVRLSKRSMYTRLRLDTKPEPKLGTAWLPSLKVFSHIVGYYDLKWKSIRKSMAERVM